MPIQEVTHGGHVIFIDPLQRADHRWTARFQVTRAGRIVCDWEAIEIPEGFVSAQLALSASVLLAEHRLSALPH
ncbi:hypothetical protein LMG7141_01989 [Ralstonia condita]|uniref:Uncharacterized protein n=1 Tax=Ralstonia condita TaxID=3058600 RepID=A0ABM9JAV1_9RALS|nr:hypothetical protein [Ralstonia sp. LMG 7141]MDE2201830.1 hypothetical protein [Burkholderiaceae bacterium]CAJ0787795.1 hypothetical protein LMG7141_01989 [Ralstonia sp. LMG 7141]